MNSEIAAVARRAAHEAVARPDGITDLSHIRAKAPLYKDKSVPAEIRVDNLLGLMTLDEKIMQLNQYTLGRNNNANNVGEEVVNIYSILTQTQLCATPCNIAQWRSQDSAFPLFSDMTPFTVSARYTLSLSPRHAHGIRYW